MIELTTNGQRLLIVPVPKDAENVAFDEAFIWYNIPPNPSGKHIILTDNFIDGTFLGTLHVENGKPVLSEGFDPEPLVEKTNEGIFFKGAKGKALYPASVALLSLITSAITKAGYTWGNPMGDFTGSGMYSTQALKEKAEREWKQAESKAIHKVAIIKIQ